MARPSSIRNPRCCPFPNLWSTPENPCFCAEYTSFAPAQKREENCALLPGGFEEATLYRKGRCRVFIKQRAVRARYGRVTKRACAGVSTPRYCRVFCVIGGRLCSHLLVTLRTHR